MENPNSNYYQPSLGTLAGFSELQLTGDNPTPVETGWSVDQLKRFLLNENEINFATNEWVLLVSQLINKHILDHNNPHNVTLEQISPDFVGGVLATVTPGTPPNVVPFFAYDGLCDLPFGTVFPALYASQNTYKVTDGGLFVDLAVEADGTVSDYITKRASLPLFGQIPSVMTNNWASLPATRVRTTLTKQAQRIVNYPFDFYMVKETETYGEFGILIPAQLVAATVYTATLLILPNNVGGSLVLSQPGDTTNLMTVDLDAGTYVCSTPNVLGDVMTFPSGVMRISFTFLSANTSSATGVKVIHKDTGDTITQRDGIDGRFIFNVAMPNVTKSTMNHPLPIAENQVARTSGMVVNLAKVKAPTLYPELMVTLSASLYPTLPTGTSGTMVVFKFGSLTITRDHLNLYVKLGEITIYTSKILYGLNNLTISYSADKIIVKDLKKPRLEYTGNFAPLQETDFSVGPCCAYLHSIALYAQADRTKCVEYLTNG